MGLIVLAFFALVYLFEICSAGPSCDYGPLGVRIAVVLIVVYAAFRVLFPRKEPYSERGVVGKIEFVVGWLLVAITLVVLIARWIWLRW